MGEHGGSAARLPGVEGYDAATYGERFADVYDDWYGRITDTDACVRTLAELANGGTVLELGIGTGRLALPLARQGVAVTGVDSSPAMLAALHAKPDGGLVNAVLGDMGAPQLGDTRFDLAFIAYNTLFNLVGDGEQQSCLANAATALNTGGRFVVEAFVPDPAHPANDAITPKEFSADHVVLSVSRSDPERQEVQGQYVDITEAGIKLRPWHIRWATAEQLDTMATAAGLQLEHRWSTWDRHAFDETSTTHVSVYRRR